MTLLDPDDFEEQDDFFDDVLPKDKPWPTQVGLFDDDPIDPVAEPI